VADPHPNASPFSVDRRRSKRSVSPPERCWRGGNWREDRSTGRSTWPDQLSGSPLIH